MAVKTARRSLAAVSRFLGVVVEAGDQQATRAFYEPIFRASPTAGNWAQTDDLTYGAGGQRVTFAAKDEPRTLPESGQHQAYRVRADQVDAVVGALERLGARVDWWHEDPPSERRLMPYTSDPSGNRVQLVPATTPGGNLIDHVAIEVHDIETAQVFYVAALGGRVAYYHGRSVQHYLEGRAWGEGADRCAPWTRFWPGHGLSTNPRSRGSHSHPTQQAFYEFGDCTLGLILANHHRQEPPEGRIRGTPRVVLGTRQSAFETAGALDAPDISLEPEARINLSYEREGNQVFLRDPGGNFVEIVCSPYNQP